MSLRKCYINIVEGAYSSVGQSTRLIPGLSQVQVLMGPPKKGENNVKNSKIKNCQCQR